MLHQLATDSAGTPEHRRLAAASLVSASHSLHSISFDMLQGD
jgi:hypothetical protein